MNDNVTLDLNNKSLKANLVFSDDSVSTIKGNGTLNGGIKLHYTSRLIIENGTYLGGIALMNSESSPDYNLKIIDGTFEACIMIGIYSDNGFWEDGGHGSVCIENGVFDVTKQNLTVPNFYHPGVGELTINGGTFTSSVFCNVLGSGPNHINGGEFTAKKGVYPLGFYLDYIGDYVDTVIEFNPYSSIVLEEVWPDNPTPEQPDKPSVPIPAKGTLTGKGIYCAQDYPSIIAAFLTEKSVAGDTVEYRWLACEESDPSNWFVVSDWTRDNYYLSWTPEKSGDYIIVVQARLVGNEEKTLISDAFGVNFRTVKAKIKDICQMPYEGGYLIGIESDINPNQSLRYEMLVMDLSLYAAGNPYCWVHSVKSQVAEGNALWTIWKPQYGYYVTLFRIYDTNDNLLDERAYGFENVYNPGTQTSSTEVLSAKEKRKVENESSETETISVTDADSTALTTPHTHTFGEEVFVSEEIIQYGKYHDQEVSYKNEIPGYYITWNEFIEGAKNYYPELKEIDNPIGGWFDCTEQICDKPYIIRSHYGHKCTECGYVEETHIIKQLFL